MVDNFILINQENLKQQKFSAIHTASIPYKCVGVNLHNVMARKMDNNSVKQELNTASIVLVSTTVC